MSALSVASAAAHRSDETESEMMKGRNKKRKERKKNFIKGCAETNNQFNSEASAFARQLVSERSTSHARHEAARTNEEKRAAIEIAKSQMKNECNSRCAERVCVGLCGCVWTLATAHMCARLHRNFTISKTYKRQNDRLFTFFRPSVFPIVFISFSLITRQPDINVYALT